MGQILASFIAQEAAAPGPGQMSAPELTPASQMLPSPQMGGAGAIPDASQGQASLPPLPSSPNVSALLNPQDPTPKNPYSTDIPASLKAAGQNKAPSFLDMMGNALLQSNGLPAMLRRNQAPTISTQADVNVPTTSLVPGAAPNTAPAGQPQSKKKGL